MTGKWMLFAIRGTYRRVSYHWLQGYLNEFVWRGNTRYAPESMFETLLDLAGR